MEIVIARNKLLYKSNNAIKVEAIDQWWCWIPSKFVTIDSDAITVDVRDTFTFDVQSRGQETQILDAEEFKVLTASHIVSSKAHIVCKVCHQLVNKCSCI